MSEAYEVARIIITRVISEDDDLIEFETEGEPRFIDVVGMMQIALSMALQQGLENEDE